MGEGYGALSRRDLAQVEGGDAAECRSAATPHPPLRLGGKPPDLAASPIEGEGRDEERCAASLRSMNRIERAIHRQIGDQPLDLPPAREMDMVAEHAILLGARRRGEAGLLAMIAAQRLAIVDRGDRKRTRRNSRH